MADDTIPHAPLDYAGNPFVEQLPRTLSLQGWIAELNDLPDHEEWERRLPAEDRHVCIRRLLRYFRAGRRQAVFARGVDAVLREGYIGRKGGVLADEARQHAVAVEAEEGDLLDPRREPVVSRRTDSSSLIGIPGMGKSRTVDRVLDRYPQRVVHPDDYVQITWVKLDCPPGGAIRTLCGDFFAEVDQIIGREVYGPMYGGQHLTNDDLMRGMVAVANRHSLGYLVIDEIQHLGAGDAGNGVLTFLTTLINRIGVPVLVIGTMAAIARFRRSGRIGRRMEGLASADWPWFEKKDPQWRKFVKELWGYQWTAVPTPYSDELSDALYEHSQGVVDFVTKLYFRVQESVIDDAAVSSVPRPEVITAEKIAEVAKAHFDVIRPMLDAIRRRNLKDIMKYEDLTPIHDEYDKLIGSNGEILDEHSFDNAGPRRFAASFAGEASGTVRQFLRQRDQSEARIDEFMGRASNEIGLPTFINLPEYLGRLSELVAEAQAETGSRRPTPEQVADTHAPGDLRAAARAAHAAGSSVPAALEGRSEAA